MNSIMLYQCNRNPNNGRLETGLYYHRGDGIFSKKAVKGKNSRRGKSFSYRKVEFYPEKVNKAIKKIRLENRRRYYPPW